LHGSKLFDYKEYNMAVKNIVKFRTESGSGYAINMAEKTWARSDNPNSLNVRTSNGVFREISRIEIGKPVTMICPPLDVGDARVIETSNVVEIVRE
jgi:hypothetical protein